MGNSSLERRDQTESSARQLIRAPSRDSQLASRPWWNRSITTLQLIERQGLLRRAMCTLALEPIEGMQDKTGRKREKNKNKIQPLACSLPDSLLLLRLCSLAPLACHGCKKQLGNSIQGVSIVDFRRRLFRVTKERKKRTYFEVQRTR